MLLLGLSLRLAVPNLPLLILFRPGCDRSQRGRGRDLQDLTNPRLVGGGLWWGARKYLSSPLLLERFVPFAATRVATGCLGPQPVKLELDLS